MTQTRPDSFRLGLHEELYCARGEMENMLKQQTLDLRADRMSTHYLAGNQLRLWLATLACLLLERMRALGLAGTDLARATAGTAYGSSSGGPGACECAPSPCAVKQRLSAAGHLPAMPSTAHGVEARQRVTPSFPCRPSFQAGGVGKNGRKTYS
jgi:hypothetical protein